MLRKTVPVAGRVACQYCGEPNLAWVTSVKGKRFLARAYHDNDESFVANVMDPHRCPVLKSRK